MTERALGSNYTLTERLGAGAMGEVWRGRDREGTALAFKLLRPELAADPDVVQRFLKERSALVGVDDPHVVRMHGLVAEDETLAIVMDLVEGGDLRDLLASRGTLTPSEVARTGAQVAAGLAAVHRAGIVHRDVKPENVLIDQASGGPVARVSDFGIARLADASAATRSTMLLGTPNYMAPEITEGHPATPAADAYSLGVVLYELCCGVTPFEGGNPMAVMRRHSESTPARPDGVPDELWGVVSELLAKDPKARPTVGQVGTYLSGLVMALQGQPAAPRLSEPLPASRAATEQVPAAAAAAGTGPTREGGATRTPEPSRKRSRKGLVAGLVATALVLGGGGVVAAQLLGGEDDPGQPVDAAATTTSAPVGTTPAPSADPSGSTAPVVAATGADATSTSPTSTAPTTTTEPPTTTTQPPTMPDVVGMTLSQARTALRGTTVTVLEEFDETASDNEVLAQDVAEGDPRPDAVELTVAKQPVSVYLDDLRAVSSDFRSGSDDLGGESYPRSLQGYDRYAGTAEWNLSRGYRRLVATVGRSDDAEHADLQVQVQVFLDQREVWSERVAVGQTVDMDIDVTDALRLRIDYTPLDRESAYLVLGDVRLLGLPGEVPEPEEE